MPEISELQKKLSHIVAEKKEISGLIRKVFYAGKISFLRNAIFHSSLPPQNADDLFVQLCDRFTKLGFAQKTARDSDAATNPYLNITESGKNAILELINATEMAEYRFRLDIKDLHPAYLQGQIYFQGLDGKKNYPEALKQYMIAASEGDARAQFMLGDIYRTGIGAKKNHDTAVKFLIQSASQVVNGNSASLDALYALAVLYTKGHGVRKNLQEAAKHYRMAAEQGHALSQAALGVCYYAGQGVTQDYTQAQRWLLKAAQKENPAAMAQRGIQYYHGHGVEKNAAQALFWTSLAVAYGRSESKADLTAIEKSLPQEVKEKAYAEATSWVFMHTKNMTSERYTSENVLLDLLYKEKSYPSLRDYHPISIIQDRYSGVYSGGSWLAIAGSDRKIDGAQETRLEFCYSKGPSDGDVQARDFWVNPPEWIAAGPSPDMSFDRLLKKSIQKMPHLKVLRETYCSQAMTDTLIDALYENRLDLLAEARDSIRKVTIKGDSKFFDVLAYLQKKLPKSIQAPSTRLGWLDLMFEFGRRLRAQQEMPDQKIMNTPQAVEVWLSALSSRHIQPKSIRRKWYALPAKETVVPPNPFPMIKITKERDGVTQKTAEVMLDLLYRRRPDILFEMSEGLRRNMRFFNIDAEFLRYATEVSPELDFPSSTPSGRWRNKLLEEIYDYLEAIMFPSTGQKAAE